MLKCRKARGLIAESLYQELGPDDRVYLEGHLAMCSRCEQEVRELAGVVDRVPVTSVSLDRDLAPILRHRLESEEIVASFTSWRFVYGAVACVLVAILVGYGLIGVGHVNNGIEVASNPPVAAVASAIQAALEEADRLVEVRDYPAAYVALAKGVKEHPEDLLAGEAQYRLADIAFTQLKWYPEAHDAYTTLQLRYRGTFQSTPEGPARLDLIVYRRELLAQARVDDFASLHSLDAARRKESFEDFEAVVSRHPATYVASLAAEEMARLAMTNEPSTPSTDRQVYAMEQAVRRCTNPIAVAQLKVEMGHAYRNEKDFDKARSLYEEVAASDTPVLAKLATESLSVLASPNSEKKQ